jgi:hypothetical protein
MNKKDKIRHLTKKEAPILEGTCQICGRLGDLQRHHVDYEIPLNYQIICVTCHRNIHKGIKITLKLSHQDRLRFYSIKNHYKDIFETDLNLVKFCVKRSLSDLENQIKEGKKLPK